MLNRWNFLKTGFYEGIKLDLRQQSSRLSESLAEVKALSATDASCARINAQVQSLQDGGLPQVEAIAEAVAV